MKNRSHIIRYGIAGAGLSLLAAAGCGAAGPGSDAALDDAQAPTAVPEVPGVAKQASQTCVTIQRGVLGNVADSQLASNIDGAHNPTNVAGDGNFGAGLQMIAGTVGKGHRKSLVRYDMSVVPAGATINSAIMTLAATPDSHGGPGNQLSVYSVTGAWTEAAVTWNTAPAYGPTVVASDSGGPGTHTFDVTSLAAAWATGTNDGVLLDQNGSYYTNFSTSETATPSQRPALHVCYTPSLCAGVTCTASDSCHVAGTCDPSTGMCSNPAAADGTACSGGTCMGGVCAPNAPAGCSFVEVSAGLAFTCGLESNGTTVCWGSNAVGQSAPPALPFTRISAGYDHACGMKSDGTLACWGGTEYGESSPPAGSFTQVGTGDSLSCAVRVGGTVACWGTPGSGGTSPPAANFTQVSMGENFGCGIVAGGTLACWGLNLGGRTSPPAGVFTQISMGDNYGCGVKADGTLACWGNNSFGQSSPPAGVFTQVSGEYFATCGLKANGTVACWGSNGYGQLNVPAGIFTQVTVGFFHACGLKPDGTAVCWGNNGYGQSSPPVSCP